MEHSESSPASHRQDSPRAGIGFARAVLQGTSFAPFLLFIMIGALEAQQSPPAGNTAATADSSTQTLTSTEQGRTPITDSFKSRREKRVEERRKAFAGTEFTWELRTYDLDRINSDDSRSAAWAIGSSAGFETGFFRDLVSFGATAYTSQPLYAPSGEGGTNLLTNNQTGYTALGEAFAQFRIDDDLGLTLGRRGIDTPYLSRNDSRMTPQTFEGVALQGVAGEGGDPGELRYGVAYFDKEKQVNSDDFVNMARVAGASVDRGVSVAGANYTHPDWGLGAVDYYSPDIINIAYTEAHYVIRMDETRSVNLQAQYTSQHSVGAELLTGGSFSANQFGGKADFTIGPALLTAAYTATGRGTEMKNPWSGYPGYTSVQYGNFDNAGENAFMVRAACNVEDRPGLSVYGLWVRGSVPQSPATQNEYDANLQWTPPSGSLRGVTFRARYAYFTESDANHVTELRLMLYYTPPSKQ
jgi:hypothetical protein